MSTLSGNANEDRNREGLKTALSEHFSVYEEVNVRHAFFNIDMRIDLIAVPAPGAPFLLPIGFETKGHEQWDIPLLAKCLKQASDYVLSTISPQPSLPQSLFGKRVMAVFIYPSPIFRPNAGPEVGSPSDLSGNSVSAKDSFFRGMIHMAGYSRVGSCFYDPQYKGSPLVLRCPNEVWIGSKGWRSDALNILSGKRQIGSQKVDILDQLARLHR